MTSKYPFTIQCSSGLISLDAVSHETGEPAFDVGIIPKSNPVNFYCSNTAFTDPANCSSFIDRFRLREQLEHKCVGRADCVIDNLDRFIKNPEPLNIVSQFNTEECFSNDSQAFIQVACMMPNSSTRKEISLLLACSATFAALFILNFIDYIARK